MEREINCQCTKNICNIEDENLLLWSRVLKPSPGLLPIGDWTKSPYTWLNCVKCSDDSFSDDNTLISIATRYWSIHDVQRYFVGQVHCEEVYFTYQYPNLQMPTLLGNYFWKANAATKLTPQFYQKEFGISLEITLKVILQKSLQLVSLENLCCKRQEGVQLIQQLACFTSDTLKYLFLWRFVLPNENPIMVNYGYITGSGQNIPQPDSARCFLFSLSQLRALQMLALEYSHIADSTGLALLSLLPIMKKPHFRLELLCREEHIPRRMNAALGAGCHDVPDTAWRRVIIACPDLYVFMAFCRVRDYDNVRRFLTPSIPLREAHLQLGVDLYKRQRQDSDISCFVRHIAYQYGDSLGTLSLHQWRFATFPLRRVLELMPRLSRFFYVGRIQDEVELRRTLHVMASGACEKLKHVWIQVQDEGAKDDYWQKVVKNLNEEFYDVIEMLNIKFCLNLYKS